ncbi:MAG TPA: copper resistance protein CopC [Chloroflexota bacterium]|nr:copper resistance protein CopC [Chloroflexota bacterium]
MTDKTAALTRVLIAVLAICAAMMGWPGGVLAHAFLVQSTPQAGARLDQSPPTISLQFGEAVAAASNDRLILRRASGQVAPLGPLTRSADGTMLSAAAPRLARGIYLVSWQNVSADDGHPSTGEFAFAVGTGGLLPTITGSESASTDWPGAIATALTLFGLALCMGGLAGNLLVWRPLIRSGNWAALPPVILGGIILTALGASVQLLLLSGSLARSPSVANLAQTIPTALSLRAGLLAALMLFLALYAGLAFVVARRQGTALFSLIVAAAALALRGHPAAGHAWWAMAAIVVHVTVALLWVGALLHLVLGFWRGRQSPWEVPRAATWRYARLAIWSALLVLATGAVAALAELQAFSQLWETLYGRLLLAKGALVSLALCLALGSRFRGLAAERAFPLLRRLTSTEIVALITMLAVAALLGNVTPPFSASPSSAAAPAPLLGPPPAVGPTVYLAGQAGWLEVYLTAGADLLTLSVRAPDDTQANKVSIALTARQPSGRESNLVPRPCGAGCLSMQVPWQRGTTILRLAVRAARWPGGSVSFSVPWPPLPAEPKLFARAYRTMSSQPAVVVHEQVRSGPGATAHSTGRLSGPSFLATEPFGPHISPVQRLPGSPVRLVLYLPGSHIWDEVWLDARRRFAREVVVAPGYFIQRTFLYPARTGRTRIAPSHPD